MRYAALFQTVRTLTLISLIGAGTAACVPVGLVSIPLNLALDAALDDDGSDSESPNPSARAAAAPTGPISVDMLLARARGEEVAEPALNSATSVHSAASGIRIDFSQGQDVAREAALVWLLSMDRAEEAPVYLTAAPDGAQSDPDAAFNGIRRANKLKAWLQATGRRVIVRFDAAGTPGTVLLSAEPQIGGQNRA
ncbi:MAG: hypothetical protein ACPGOV_14410 [Magnetovibrionaceae bacterium]